VPLPENPAVKIRNALIGAYLTCFQAVAVFGRLANSKIFGASLNRKTSGE
jgi:hypothetical protein